MKELNGQLAKEHVDVCAVCITFNQAEYIEACIEGMIKQVGHFSYYVVVHDDASTDGTTSIVERYAAAYPNLILALIEEENQYSKGVLPTELMAEYVNSDYIAICEGDDWWIDTNKVCKQLEIMRENSHCALCAHETATFRDKEGFLGYSIAPSKTSRFFTIEDIILGGGAMFGTSSLFMRSRDIRLRGVFSGWGVGDYPRVIQCATEGSVYYINEPMSVYRVDAVGSWSRRQLASLQSAADGMKKIISGLRSFDEASAYKYHLEIDIVTAQYNYSIAVAEGNLRLLLCKECRDVARTLSNGQKVKDIIKCSFPSLYRYYLSWKLKGKQS